MSVDVVGGWGEGGAGSRCRGSLPTRLTFAFGSSANLRSGDSGSGDSGSGDCAPKCANTARPLVARMAGPAIEAAPARTRN